MRSRQQIKNAIDAGRSTSYDREVIIEILLDIREILGENKHKL